MRKLILIAVFLPVVLLAGILVILVGIGEEIKDRCETTIEADEPVSPSFWRTAFNPSGLTVDGVAITPVQLANAGRILTVVYGEKTSQSDRAGMIALITAMTESHLINVDYGDRDSLGLFQQRTPWGTLEQRMDPEVSTKLFLYGGSSEVDGYEEPGLFDTADWAIRPMGEVAQDVQVSAYPYRYAEFVPEAQKLIETFTGEEVVYTNTVNRIDCEEEDKIELAVQEALSRNGEPYTWGNNNSTGFLVDVFEEVGILLPDSADELAEYVGDPEAGISAELVPVEEIVSPDDLEPGDILGWSVDGENEEIKWSVNAGTEPLFGETDIDIGTYNVWGSNHTGHASAMRRIPLVAKNIEKHQVDIVGMQEFQQDQRIKLMSLLPNFSVFPDLDHKNRYESVNSIIYNTDKYELVKGSWTPMPKYFNNRDTDIPLILLRDKDTDQEFYVLNTHDPAKPIYAHLRYLAGQEHAKITDKLSLNGLPIYFPGDFNSGFGVRFTQGNRTYKNERKYLTWCLMTKSGVMRNAYDALKGRQGCSRKTTKEKGIGIVDHIYVSEEVDVEKYVVEWKNTGSDAHPFVYIRSKVGSGADTVEPRSKNHTLAIGQTGKRVGINQIKVPGQLVTVLRLKVADPETNVSATDGEWVFPFAPGTFAFTDGYGLEGSRFHNGSDFGARGLLPNPKLVAMHGGTVLRAEYDPAWGNFLMVDTHVPYPGKPGKTILYLYAHLNLIPAVNAGEKIETGQYVGNVGDTGYSFGEHLHLTMGYDKVMIGGSSVGSAGSEDPLILMEKLGIWPQ